MKKVFLALLFLGAFTTANATDLEKKDDKKIKSSKIESFVKKGNTTTSTVSYEEFFGTCHIRIVDNRTGETVVDQKLPANSAEACKKMLEDTLDALNR